MNPNPKNRLKCFSIILALFTATCSVNAQSDASVSRPNIVYILTDDMGYGDVHALNPGRCKIATPNLDSLCAQGMAFTDCHASSSICSPSRYSILTGRYDWRTRLQHGIITSDGEPLISRDRLTVAGFLKQHGYVTAALGKWHLGLLYDKKDF